MTATTTTTTVDTTVTLNTEAADTMHAAILSGVRDFLKARRDLIRVVKEAQKSNLHTLKGHDTWESYATATVAEALPKNAAKQEREWIATLLVHVGVGTRAAAKATGTSPATVSRRSNGETGAEVAAEVAEVTGDKADAKKATTSTGADGKKRDKAATASNAKKSEATPKEQPKRTAHAVASEAAATISGVWHNLTVEQRTEIAEMILNLPAIAE